MNSKPKWWREDEVLCRVIKRDNKGLFLYVGSNKLRPMDPVPKYRAGDRVYVSDSGWVNHQPAKGIIRILVNVRFEMSAYLFRWV